MYSHQFHQMELSFLSYIYPKLEKELPINDLSVSKKQFFYYIFPLFLHFHGSTEQQYFRNNKQDLRTRKEQGS